MNEKQFKVIGLRKESMGIDSLEEILNRVDLADYEYLDKTESLRSIFLIFRKLSSNKQMGNLLGMLIDDTESEILTESNLDDWISNHHGGV